jgi:SAM-dependent methyltransferase
MDVGREPIPEVPDSVISVVDVYSGPKFMRWSSLAPELWAHEHNLITTFCEDRSLRILVAGSGGGRETLGLYAMGFRDVTGIDPTPKLVHHAQERAAAMQVPVVFRIAHAASLPFPDASFDVVTMFENLYGHITPREARLEALAEVSRVLEHRGVILLEATSLRARLLHYVAIRLMGIGQLVHNPHDLERGDRLMRESKELVSSRGERLPRSHWFSPGEVPSDARSLGLVVELASTSAGVVKDPHVTAKRYRGQGRLEYVLRKP